MSGGGLSRRGIDCILGVDGGVASAETGSAISHAFRLNALRTARELEDCSAKS